MSEEEATIILKIMMTADSNCAYCAASLLSKFAKAFPIYRGLATEIWRTECLKLCHLASPRRESTL